MHFTLKPSLRRLLRPTELALTFIAIFKYFGQGEALGNLLDEYHHLLWNTYNHEKRCGTYKINKYQALFNEFLIDRKFASSLAC